MKIHPTAIVSPSARIADNVEIGPCVVIEGGAAIGEGCVIQAHAVIEGSVIMGTGNIIGYGSVIGAAPQDFAHKPEISSAVRIGNDNRIREYVTIHRGTKEGTETVIGNGCFLMVGTHLGHNVALADNVIITNNCLLAGYVSVGESAVLGGGSVFHQFMRIGRRAMVAGSSSFNKDVPPFVTANFRNLLVGINVVGLRRGGISPSARMEIKRAFKLVYRSGLRVREALEEAAKSDWGPEALEFFEFIRSSKRGTCTSNRLADSDITGGEE
ncbi:MAG: acyl-ACP--UDP-N-acetylglucosamine O-acyltransferase [Verrucomicrobiaceae bacterium]|nr:MAG: acyl-ACP--UDP-N-acetylglucosamine O-acyltransferase [Verrucomicrobiaceae bacterium]